MIINALLFYGVVGIILSAIIYGIRYSIWKEQVPNIISKTRWIIAFATVVGLALLEDYVGIDSNKYMLINVGILFIIGKALKNEKYNTQIQCGSSNLDEDSK